MKPGRGRGIYTAKEKESLRIQVGRQVRVLRVMRGWTQEVLAELAGLHRNYVGYIERGEHNAGIDNLERLASALGVPLRRLMEKG
ncbi:MAG TPA: helix-turn-helix transcriptional regulator [Acidiferrobacterales bacterium]